MNKVIENIGEKVTILKIKRKVKEGDGEWIPSFTIKQNPIPGTMKRWKWNGGKDFFEGSGYSPTSFDNRNSKGRIWDASRVTLSEWGSVKSKALPFFWDNRSVSATDSIDQ